MAARCGGMLAPAGSGKLLVGYWLAGGVDGGTLLLLLLIGFTTLTGGGRWRGSLLRGSWRTVGTGLGNSDAPFPSTPRLLSRLEFEWLDCGLSSLSTELPDFSDDLLLRFKSAEECCLLSLSSRSRGIDLGGSCFPESSNVGDNGSFDRLADDRSLWLLCCRSYLWWDDDRPLSSGLCIDLLWCEDDDLSGLWGVSLPWEEYLSLSLEDLVSLSLEDLVSLSLDDPPRWWCLSES